MRLSRIIPRGIEISEVHQHMQNNMNHIMTKPVHILSGTANGAAWFVWVFFVFPFGKMKLSFIKITLDKKMQLNTMEMKTTTIQDNVKRL